MAERGALRTRQLAAYDFHAGNDTHAYTYFGVHREGERGYVFRLYAPDASSVSLCGDFLPLGQMAMYPVGERGVWELGISSEISPEGMRYAFCADGREIPDPYARRGLWGGEVGSLVCTEGAYVWQDAPWMDARRHRGATADRPLNFYWVHPGSFATRQGRSCVGGDAYLNYRELGDLLARYVSDMGYTHIRLMPLTEHGEDASFGYLSDGYFAPTSRHGSPDDLRAMIGRLHRAGLGVVMDLPVGRCAETLYGVGQGGRPALSCPPTRSFLLSAALFWLREFHLDGLCPVGLEMLSPEAREGFGRDLCAAVRSEFPEAILIGGEGAVWEWGFDLITHRRFPNDVTQYLGAEPSVRPFLRDRLALTLWEVSEQGRHALIPLSGTRHGSLLGGMHGSYLQRFDGVRLALAYQMAHPGKKQLFMGDELGQLRPWDGTVPPDWFLRELEPNAQLWQYVRTLNHFYRTEPRLWRDEGATFRVDPSDGILVLTRSDGAGKVLFALFNFAEREATCRLAVGGEHPSLRELFGSGGGWCAAEGGAGEILLTLPPMTALFCEPTEKADDATHVFILPPRKEISQKTRNIP